MSYSVKEMFLTLQGEGRHAGRVAVFVRFSGCNLWSGRAQDRTKAACSFCDTDFVGINGDGGAQFESAKELADSALDLWPTGGEPMLVCTGGEPLLQLDEPLITAFKNAGFMISVETNGTIKAPAGIDWLCVSPKADMKLAQTSGDELKLVYPQPQNHPDDYSGLSFSRFSLQPLENDHTKANTKAAIAYCLAHPKWQLSLQTHKWTNIR